MRVRGPEKGGARAGYQKPTAALELPVAHLELGVGPKILTAVTHLRPAATTQPVRLPISPADFWVWTPLNKRPVANKINRGPI